MKLEMDPPGELVHPDTVLEDPKLPLEAGASCHSVAEAFEHLQNKNILAYVLVGGGRAG